MKLSAHVMETVRRENWLPLYPIESWVSLPDDNTYHLGNFTDETAAALAYNAFVRAHCPEFGYLNPISGATRVDEPTVAVRARKKRRSKLIKLTLTERRIQKLRASMARAKRTEERRRQIEAERLATRKPWEPGDPTLPSPIRVRLRSPRPAGSLTHFTPQSGPEQ